MRRIPRSAAIVVLAGLAFVVGWYRLPYYAVGPGPAREVGPLIHVEDHQRFPSEGKLIMTTVRWYPVTALQAVVAWIDPNQAVVEEEVLYPPGQAPKVEEERAKSEMDRSKIDATYVVLSNLTDYPDEHAPGALIETTVEDCPAYGRLFAGDLILAVDGERIRSSAQASRAIDAVPAGDPITFRVLAGGETTDVDITRATCGRESEQLVGISLLQPFPFPVEISSGDIGGPSAGLMFALGLYDTLTPGDLTDGLTIAGTGTITTNGDVGGIGGIADKVVAAERVGASVFLVPADNMAELNGLDTGDMRLIPVRSFEQAVEALEGLAAGPS